MRSTSRIRDSGETRRVRVVWRDGLQVGVAYEAAALPFAPEAARQIRKLEADRNALARRLAQSDQPVRWNGPSPAPSSIRSSR